MNFVLRWKFLSVYIGYIEADLGPFYINVAYVPTFAEYILKYLSFVNGFQVSQHLRII